MPGPSPEAQRAAPLAAVHRTGLFEVASRSIDHGLTAGSPLRVDPREHPSPLRDPCACFVTLRRAGALRGCVGELEAHRSVVESVADRAFHAAFRDPRFAGKVFYPYCMPMYPGDTAMEYLDAVVDSGYKWAEEKYLAALERICLAIARLYRDADK